MIDSDPRCVTLLPPSRVDCRGGCKKPQADSLDEAFLMVRVERSMRESGVSYETDNRLKGYLDSNQLHREQMCLAILALDKRFTEVRPRHPRGGPDGGRDIEARFRKEQLAFAAVGFANQADDSDRTKAIVRSKYKQDLASAMDASPAPQVFVFMTNVNFTIAEKDALAADARARGLTHCEIFDRERLRIALDSADGFAARFQFLGIPLSEEEQATFFAKWGDDINSLITTGFQSIQRTLDQLLFLQEARDSIERLHVIFELDQAYPAEEIGHFRAFCSIFLREPKLGIVELIFGASDRANRFRSDLDDSEREDRAGIKFGIGSGQWEWRPTSESGDVGEVLAPESSPEQRFELVGSASAVGMDEVRFVSIGYGDAGILRFRPVLTLADFDGCWLVPILNKSLALRLKRFHVVANGYKLLEISREGFKIDESEFDPGIPAKFDPSELEDRWVRVRPAPFSSAFNLGFSEEVPVRLYVSRRARNTHPIRGLMEGSDDGTAS